MTLIQNSLSLVRRGWRSILALTTLISIGCFVFALALGDVFTQAAVLRGGQTLRAEDAVSFTTFYKEGAVSVPSQAALKVLVQEFDADRAYSAVINNTAVTEPASSTDDALVLLFGDAIPDLYPDLQLCSPAPCAMHGASVANDSAVDLPYLGMRIPVEGELPDHATWFDPNSTGIPLAQHTVVRLPAAAVERLDPYAQEEVLSRAVLLRPSSVVVDSFVSEVRSSEIYLVPNRLAAEQPRAFREVLSRSGLYLAGFGAYVALMFIIMSSSLRALLERESARFKIHRMSGATNWEITGIVAGFLGTSIILLPLLVCAPLLLLGGSFADGYKIVAIGCGAIWLAQTLWSSRSLQSPEVGRIR